MSDDLDKHFHVFKKGQLTVIGFNALHATKRENAVACRDRLLEIIEENACQDLVVDLAEMPIVSSWILGLLVAVQKSGIRVHAYHPSEEVREAIDFTRLNTVFDMREGLDNLSA